MLCSNPWEACPFLNAEGGGIKGEGQVEGERLGTDRTLHGDEGREGGCDRYLK